MKTLDFGKHEGEKLAECPVSYLKWLASHNLVLAVRNRWASRLARKLLEEKEEVMSKEYDISYEEYKDQELLVLWTDWDGPTLEELEAEYPGYASHAKADADARRGGTPEEYQAKKEAANPPEQEAIFVLDRACKAGEIIKDGKYQYRTVEDAEWISAKEAAEIAEFADPSAASGWHVKAELVA
jgi:hypothetical protein